MARFSLSQKRGYGNSEGSELARSSGTTPLSKKKTESHHAIYFNEPDKNKTEMNGNEHPCCGPRRNEGVQLSGRSSNTVKKGDRSEDYTLF